MAIFNSYVSLPEGIWLLWLKPHLFTTFQHRIPGRPGKKACSHGSHHSSCTTTQPGNYDFCASMKSLRHFSVLIRFVLFQTRKMGFVKHNAAYLGAKKRRTSSACAATATFTEIGHALLWAFSLAVFNIAAVQISSRADTTTGALCAAWPENWWVASK